MLYLFIYLISIPAFFFLARLYNTVETNRREILTPGFSLVIAAIPLCNILGSAFCLILYFSKLPQNSERYDKFFNWFTCGKTNAE